MRDRPLTDEERRLWRAMSRTVQPMKKPASAFHAGDTQIPHSKSAPAAKSADRRSKSATAHPIATPQRPRNMHNPAAAHVPKSLDTRLQRQLRRGSAAIDQRLDLHGMHQAEARHALERFLHSAAARGCRNVLVITGKGQPGAGTGVLRSAVPKWLALPPFRDLVAGVSEAGQRHGGAGALYVRLRRRPGTA